MSNYTERSEWLATLKVGDEVHVSGHYGAGSIEKVTHATTKYVDVGRTRYRRDCGAVAGKRGYTRVSLYQPTDDIRLRIERETLIKGLSYTKWHELPTEKLRAAWAAVEACKT